MTTSSLQLPTNLFFLPNELLIEIALHLDCEAPSLAKFSHEPSPKLTISETAPIKNLSSVCKRWRRITLPVLFQYLRISLGTEKEWVVIDRRLIERMQFQLTKLSNHEFDIYKQMRTRLKGSQMFTFDGRFDYLFTNLCRVQDGDEFLRSEDNTLYWLPYLPRRFIEFVRFLDREDLKRYIKSVVVQTDTEYDLKDIATADSPLQHSVHEIWTQIFSLLDPPRIVVAAPPTTIAGLLDVAMQTSDAWAFDMALHYIELIRLPKDQHHPSWKTHCRRETMPLIHRQPWSHLAYNQGSFIKAYSTYEYHLKEAPKMLYLVLEQLNQIPACCNIHTFSLTSIFPFISNIALILSGLAKIPCLRNLTFRLGPHKENPLHFDQERLGRAQPQDLWLDWCEDYTRIVRFLNEYDFDDGAVFWTRDWGQFSDSEDGFVEKLVGEIGGWRDEGRGVWVKVGRGRGNLDGAEPPGLVEAIEEMH